MKRSLFLLLSMIIAIGTSSLSSAGEYSVYPKVHFQTASTWVSVKNTCIDGDYILHTQKDFTLVSYCDDNGSNCTYEKRPLMQPIISTNKRCKKFDSDVCVEWQTYEYVQGPTVKVKVYPSESEAKKEQNLKKVIPYTLKECSSI